MLCKVDGCGRDAEAVSYFCAEHAKEIQYAYRGKKMVLNPWLTLKCSIDGCGKPTKTSTCRFCAMHYTRYFRHGDPSILNKQEWRSQCKVDGCMGPAIGRGYCSKHYQRFMRNGDVNVDNSQGEKVHRFIRDTVLPFAEDRCLLWPFYRDPDGYAGKIRRIN